jgi:ATP-binding cassette, subfamily B, bacterial
MTRTTASGDRLLAEVARRGWAWLGLLGCASLAGTAAVLALPAVVGRAVDAAIVGHAPGDWLVICALLVTLLAIAEAVAELAGGVSMATATARMREMLAARVLAVGPRLAAASAGAASAGAASAGAAFSAGDTVSRVVGAAVDAGAGPSSMVTSVVAAIPPAGAVIALGLIDPWLAAAFVFGYPALGVALRRLTRDSSRIAMDYSRTQGAIAACLLDALAGARTIAAAGSQDRERARIIAPVARLREHGYAAWRVQARAAAQGMIIAPALQLTVLAVAGLELARHRITPGELVAASQYALLAVGIGATTSMIARLGRARGGARRAAELLAVRPPAYGTAALPAPSVVAAPAGVLRLRGVSVRRGDESVLRGLDLTIPGGAAVALVGRSGAGKSTLAQLAGRLADPDEGRVTLDGTDLRELSRASLRAAVVYAFDRPSLVGATPEEVISFGIATPAHGQLTLGQLTAAAEDSQAAVFITRLPNALRADLAHAPLSGGEMQRLGLARAFAHAAAARLVILDDAMSSLDTVTEMQVSRALTERLRGRTRLIVAHRAATAARADLVAWLDEGRIRALARHEDLWRDAGYRALFGC